MKKYTCNWCGTKQKIKDEQIELRQINDRMATGHYGPWAKCKKVHRMLTANEVESIQKMNKVN